MIELYGIPASRAPRSIWAIEEVGVEYEHVPTRFLEDDARAVQCSFRGMSELESPLTAPETVSGRGDVLRQDATLVAVIAAAIHQHRRRQR